MAGVRGKLCSFGKQRQTFIIVFASGFRWAVTKDLFKCMFSRIDTFFLYKGSERVGVFGNEIEHAVSPVIVSIGVQDEVEPLSFKDKGFIEVLHLDIVDFSTAYFFKGMKAVYRIVSGDDDLPPVSEVHPGSVNDCICFSFL